jgi:hypothetical protein
MRLLLILLACLFATACATTPEDRALLAGGVRAAAGVAAVLSPEAAAAVAAVREAEALYCAATTEEERALLRKRLTDGVALSGCRSSPVRREQLGQDDDRGRPLAASAVGAAVAGDVALDVGRGDPVEPTDARSLQPGDDAEDLAPALPPAAGADELDPGAGIVEPLDERPQAGLRYSNAHAPGVAEARAREQ